MSEEPSRFLRICPRCQREDPPEGFYSNGYCKPCGAAYHRARREDPVVRERIKEQQRASYRRNPQKAKDYARERGRTLKQAALDAYGPACACCGEGQFEFMAIDHIEGNGRQHRMALGVSAGAGFYAWLKREGYPDGFRVLCHNCNMAAGFYGKCPHPNGVTGLAASGPRTLITDN